ncbi:MAG: HlyC/CorC family transporter [Anaerolineae bacterium]|nr:HlyC/CorC family transporter [Anaerolineae bacterium]
MFELVIILVLLLTNGILALAEIAIVSSRKARLKQLAAEGHKGARAAMELASEPSQFLSSVQIGITLVGILMGAFGGAALSEPLAAVLAQIPFIAPYASQIAFAILVVIITYLSLVIGELAPKRLALTNPEQFAIFIAPSMRALAKITAPLVRFLSSSTEAILRILNVPLTSEQTVTEEEIKHMIDEGTLTGVFEESEREIVGRVFRLGDLDVNALMTPRPEIVGLDIEDNEQALRRKLTLYPHTRFPVIRGSIDTILGIVATKDLTEQILNESSINLAPAMRSALFVPEGMSALALLERFKAERAHLAIVTDEYGSVSGLVTINDLVEAIVGEIPSLGELHEPEVVKRQDGSYLVDGKLPTHEFKEKFDFKTLPDEEDGYYQTVGGFVMAMLGRVPRAGDSFVWNNWRVEVMDMDGRRVDKVLFMLAPGQESGDTSTV